MSAVPRLLTTLAIAVTALTTPLSGQSGNFGQTSAAAGRDVFVGQPANFYGPGIVYLYRMGAGPVGEEAARLVAPDSALGDGFGQSMAAAGGRLLVGGRGSDGSGAVVLFERAGGAAGEWRAGAVLNGPGGDASADFGAAVALDEGIGFVGAPGAGSAGVVYQISTVDGLAVTSELRAPSLPESGFGAALSLEGDLLLVGAPAAASGNGAAVVYRRDGGEWIEEAVLSADGAGQERGRLGTEVLLDAGRAFVGAPGGRGDPGSVIVFERGANGWGQTARLTADDPTRGAGFGVALAASGNQLWVGAPRAGGGDGAVYRFASPAGGRWNSAGQILADSANTAAWPFGFGTSITVAGELAVVGMPMRDFGEGRAAILTPAANDTWEQTSTVLGQIATAVSAIETGADCEEGAIELFECSNMEVVSFTPVSELGGARGVWVNDVWGWTDPETKRDYAIVSRRDGAAFVDLTDPAQPRLMGTLPRTAGSRPSVWRDIKVFQNHAYVVSDGAGAHGMQIFDLTRLRSVTDAPVTFTEDTRYDRIQSAHNVVADTASGFLYVVGATGGGDTCGGGLHMIDANDPKAPVFAGCYTNAAGGRARGYTHDAQCMVYRGPDRRYEGRQICVGSNEVEINIADVTDKDNPIVIGRSGYPNVAYAHQGWFDETQRYFYMGDEGDEVAGLVDRTRTLVWDLAELDDPILIKEYFGPVASSDHNLYVKDDRAYMSNYGSGLRVLDISDPENPHEIAFFDSAPLGNNEAGMSSTASGAWSNYPFFESGVVVFTSVREGLFVVRVKPRELIP